MKATGSLLFLIVISITIRSYSQSTEVNPVEANVRTYDEKYQYDDSMLRGHFRERGITKSPKYPEEIRKLMDSVGLALSLTQQDKISVYKNIATVTKNKLIGFVDFKGVVVFKPKFQQAFNVKGTNYWIAQENNNWGLINPVSQRKIQFEFKYSSLNTLGSGFYGYGNPNRYMASKNNLYGAVDSLENSIIPFDYEELDASQRDRYRVRKNNRCGFIDSLNNILVPIVFDECSDFYENELAPAKKDKWGLINKTGDFVVQPIYDDMFTFQKGYLRVKKNGKVGFLDVKGKIIIPLLYDDADAYYKDEVLRVKLNNKYGILNKNGKNLCEFKYEGMAKFRYNCSLVRVGNLVGVINNSGAEIIPVQFEKVEIGEKIINVYRGGVETRYDHNGNQIKQ